MINKIVIHKFSKAFTKKRKKTNKVQLLVADRGHKSKLSGIGVSNDWNLYILVASRARLKQLLVCPPKEYLYFIAAMICLGSINLLWVLKSICLFFIVYSLHYWYFNRLIIWNVDSDMKYVVVWNQAGDVDGMCKKRKIEIIYIYWNDFSEVNQYIVLMYMTYYFDKTVYLLNFQ